VFCAIMYKSRLESRSQGCVDGAEQNLILLIVRGDVGAKD